MIRLFCQWFPVMLFVAVLANPDHYQWLRIVLMMSQYSEARLTP